jgi:hypothetical protein
VTDAPVLLKGSTGGRPGAEYVGLARVFIAAVEQDDAVLRIAIEQFYGWRGTSAGPASITSRRACYTGTTGRPRPIGSCRGPSPAWERGRDPIPTPAPNFSNPNPVVTAPAPGWPT